MLKEFRDFAIKGNMIDLAVGVIIGTAFGKIVSSLVDDVIMPPVGKLLGSLDFANYYVPLSSAITPGLPLADAKKLGPVLAWGNFLSSFINFLILAFCVFLIVKAIQSARSRFESEKAETPATPSEEVKLLSEIRDALKSK
jgi:large conductance mechanosensitive channel